MNKLWKHMTDVEKGALLLAKYEGVTIQILMTIGAYWRDISSNETSHFSDSSTYRIKPEPVVTKVTLYGDLEDGGHVDRYDYGASQYHITFNTIDGLADYNSIKMGPANE